ncbi:MAG: hypothetical protein Q4D33_08320 [Prevotellaceae bacterium]|nr:hypothetical protein [Prevotellaceae bacterium]
MQWINRVLRNTAKAVHRENPRLTNATIEVLNNQIMGASVADIKAILKRELDIKCILHSDTQCLEAANDSTRVNRNDLIVVSAYDTDLDAITALMGCLK